MLIRGACTYRKVTHPNWIDRGAARASRRHQLAEVAQRINAAVDASESALVRRARDLLESSSGDDQAAGRPLYAQTKRLAARDTAYVARRHPGSSHATYICACNYAGVSPHPIDASEPSPARRPQRRRQHRRGSSVQDVDGGRRAGDRFALAALDEVDADAVAGHAVMVVLRFPLAADLLQRLPRHPDYKYERINGQAWISPRPRPLRFHRPTAAPVSVGWLGGIEIREIDADRDRDGIAKLVLDVWTGEDPYRSVQGPETMLRSEIDRSLDALELGAVALDESEICAAGLVTVPGEERWLSWLTVASPVRERGVATALLATLAATLARRRVATLHSATSVANVASLRWHLSRGFALAPDPIREAWRQAGSPEQASSS